MLVLSLLLIVMKCLKCDYFVDADDGALNVNDDAVSVIDSSDISSVLDYFDVEHYNDENDEAEVDDNYDDENIIVINSEDEQAVIPLTCMKCACCT